MRCSVCGHEYEVEEAGSRCQGCPLGRTCDVTCCPNCGYGMPTRSRLMLLIKWIRELI